MTAAQREFDIVLYGATGFVGKLTAQYLADGRRPGAHRAGRPIVAKLPRRPRVPRRGGQWVGADRGRGGASRPRSTTWPPAPGWSSPPSARTPSTGCPLVAACAAAGTDYADLTGETMFIRESIDLFHKEAADNGARIVHSCGFDSIPSDLTVYALYKRALADGAGELGETNFVLRGFAGGVSGGTAASMVEVMHTSSTDPEARRAMNDPYTLTTDRGAEPELGHQSDTPWRRGRDIAPELDGIWTGAFVDGRDERANRAAQQRVARLGLRPHVPLRGEHERGVVGRRARRRGAWHRRQRRRARPRQPVLRQAAPRPGRARPAQARHRTERTGPRERPLPVETYTTTTSGARYRATMAQQGDPGYKATSVLLGECGLALAFDRDALSDLRGVLTPAASHRRRAADPASRRGRDAGDRTRCEPRDRRG